MTNVWRYLKGSTQLEAFHERYQLEGEPTDLSIQVFCSVHNVPYNCFERHHPFVTGRTTATPLATVIPMKGSMTSEEYIIKLMYTIECLNSMVTGLSRELAALRKLKAEDNLERKRPMAMIEAKDQDIMNLIGQMGQMGQILTEMSCIRKALEYRSHQLTNRNCGQFGIKTNRTGAKKNLKGHDDDHGDYSVSSVPLSSCTTSTTTAAAPWRYSRK